MLPQQSDNKAVEQARKLDSQIRQLAHHAHIVIEALYALVAEAKATNIHESLGFPSWPAYIADALDGQWKITKDKRGEVVRFLATQGMSQRAISRITGVGKGTVGRELAGAPLGQVIGLDGKTYTRPEIDQCNDDAEETDEEFIERWTREHRERDGKITIPATIEECAEQAERIVTEQRRATRIMFGWAFTGLEKLPASVEVDARSVGLHFAWLKANTVWCIEDGLSIEEIAENNGVPVWEVEEWREDMFTGNVAQYVSEVLQFAMAQLEDE